MTAGKRFALGAIALCFAVGTMIYLGIKEAGVYFLQPSELLQRIERDSSFRTVGVKVGAKVVPNTITRDPAARRIDFRVSDSTGAGFNVTYTGNVPDTFTDENDIEVILAGKLGDDGVFRATEVIAKCGSRYEAELDKLKKT